MDSHRALSLSGAAREGCGLANGELERLLEVSRGEERLAFLRARR